MYPSGKEVGEANVRGRILNLSQLIKSQTFTREKGWLWGSQTRGVLPKMDTLCQTAMAEPPGLKIAAPKIGWSI